MTLRLGWTAMACIALLLGEHRSGGASEIEYTYTFRGKVDGILSGNADMGGLVWPQSAEIAGASIRVGDPYVTTVVVEPIAPTWTTGDSGPAGALAQYMFPDGQSSFEIDLGGQSIRRQLGGTDLSIAVTDSPAFDAITGLQDFGRVDALIRLTVGRFNLQGLPGDVISGTGLPLSLPLAAFQDHPFQKPAQGLQFFFDDGTWFEVIASIDAIDVTIEDDPTPGGPIGPGPANPSTPVPEPGMMTLFGGMALAVLARRRLRGRATA